MVPIEALAMSSGRDIAEFADAWQDEIRKSMAEDEGDEADEGVDADGASRAR